MTVDCTFLFQIHKAIMGIQDIAKALDEALSDWQESDDDSKKFFGDLVVSGKYVDN